MTPHELADVAALLCAIASLGAVAAICGIFGLYAIEDRLRGDADE